MGIERKEVPYLFFQYLEILLFIAFQFSNLRHIEIILCK